MLLVLLACADPEPAGEEAAPLPDPRITSAEVSCDEDAAAWAFAVEADAWTGNGKLIWSVDGRYVEYHDLDSVESAPDGSSDRLVLELRAVADRAFVQPGSTTLFNCHEPGLAAVLRVLTVDGESASDCRRFGEDRWGEWYADYACAVEVTPG